MGFFSSVYLFELPIFETHTFGALPFGFSSALNVKAFIASVVQTTRHWHVVEAVILKVIFASLTSVTFRLQPGILLAGYILILFNKVFKHLPQTLERTYGKWLERRFSG